jgi:hypothetical protein
VCTVSIITVPGGLRLVHSRDEQRTRSPAEPPTRRRDHPLEVLSPRDPDAGGTWVAARADGLVLAVMNVNPTPPPPLDRATLRSRGLIIPALLALPASDIAPAVARLEPGLFAPFRLVASSPFTGVSSWTWSGLGRLTHDNHTTPVCWPTSGLGDDLVARRLPLFEEMVAPAPSPAAQDAFHAHRWADLPHPAGAQSVLMSRPDAQTVSITTIESAADAVRMAYRAVRPGADAWEEDAWQGYPDLVLRRATPAPPPAVEQAQPGITRSSDQNRA